jgi:formylglycine-generating enzyme required for sulfatase activity
MPIGLVSWIAIALAALAAPDLARADGLMLVAAGAFWMGRDDGPPDEGPLHRVFVTDFWIERHKVTNAEFAAFLDATGLRPAGAERRYDEDDPDARIHFRGGRWAADPGFEDHPAVEVSWFGARDYCRWRGRRLPTEAEWEKVAREASLYRVEDMLGNLREWTSTVFRPYPYKASDGREGFTGVGAVVVRGASHDDPAHDLAVTRRRSYERRGAAAGHHFVGFRCATSEDLGGY